MSRERGYQCFFGLALLFWVVGVFVFDLGVYSDYSAFYISAQYWLHGMNPYQGGALPEVIGYTEGLKAAQYVFTPGPNTPPIYYLMLYPIWFLPYKLSVQVYSMVGGSIALWVCYLSARKAKFDPWIACFLMCASYTFYKNQVFGQAGFWVFALLGGIHLLDGTDRKGWQILLTGLLVAAKPFFGLLFVLYFWRRDYKLLVGSVLTMAVLTLVSFKGDLGMVAQYKDVLSEYLPVTLSSNISIAGFLFHFIVQKWVVLGVYLGAAAYLLWWLYRHPSVANTGIVALLLNPLSLVYYYSVALFLLLDAKSKQHLYGSLIGLAMLNVPVVMNKMGPTESFAAIYTGYGAFLGLSVLPVIGVLLMLRFNEESTRVH